MAHAARRRQVDLERRLSRPGPVLVVFERPGSEACREIEAVIEEVSGDLTGRVPVVRVDDVERGTLAQRYRVREVPTMALYYDGREIGRIEGTVGPATLRAHLEFLLTQESRIGRRVVAS